MSFFSAKSVILRQPRKYLRLRFAKKIIIGASKTCYPGWVSTNEGLLDVTKRSDFARYWKPGSRYAFLAEHVWEHLTDEERIRANDNCFEFLRQGGRLRICVPDGFHPDLSYINEVRVGGLGVGAYDHKVLYDYRLLKLELERAGFKLELLEYWDENSAFNIKKWSAVDGPIQRSSGNDARNRHGALKYTSLIADAIKS